MSLQRKGQVVAGWSAIFAIICLAAGLGPFAGIAPPLSPNITAAEITAHIQENWYNIQIGMFLVNVGAGLTMVMVAGMCEEIRRIESPYGRPLTYAALATGTAACAFLFLPAMIMSVAAFRLDRDPQMMLLLHDLATFCTFMPFSVATLNTLIFGWAIVIDKAPNPTFPRWIGIWAIVYALLLVPMGLLGIDKHGSLASDGLWGWWIPTIVTIAWYLVIGYYLIVNGGKQADNPATTG